MKEEALIIECCDKGVPYVSAIMGEFERVNPLTYPSKGYIICLN